MALYYDELLIKTLVADSPVEIDRLCNGFNKDNSVRAMHSNVIATDEGLTFVYTLFYLPKKDLPKPVQEEQPVLSKIPSILVPEAQAQWTNCTICKARWKFTHYRMCPQRHGIEGLPDEFKARYKEIWNGDGNDGSKGINTGNQTL